MGRPVVRAVTGIALAIGAASLVRVASASSVVAPVPVPEVDAASVAGRDTAVFAGGCFWGVQAVFQHLNGVVSATSGYAGGRVPSPSYEQVSSGGTGHAEVVRVVYDPAAISYATLLQVFFSIAHDPTELNRQGPDVGTQYRSAIFYRNAAQRQAAEAYVGQLTRARVFPRPIVTQVAPLDGFFEAEAYHQDYATRHPNAPYILINDRPKIEALRKSMPRLWREEITGR